MNLITIIKQSICFYIYEMSLRVAVIFRVYSRASIPFQELERNPDFIIPGKRKPLMHTSFLTNSLPFLRCCFTSVSSSCLHA